MQTKKKRNKGIVSNCENAEKLLAVSLPPDILPLALVPPQSPGQSQDQVPKIRASTKKKRERKRENHRKDSPATLTENHKSDGNGDSAQGYVTVLNVPQHSLPAQTLSLRWEGVLQDPQAEAKRLEQYRANRRQRYIAHREALLKETQDALRQTFPKEKKVPAKCDQQEAASLLQLSRH
ncbi:protein LIAT1 isoform X1 [Haplochromis burtoni]|uniref:protein LIAT1 isoform X1 n=1 Tax=Haplochromis burtoni TaxID=8153 RepID=UPI0006C9A48A|nr:protein LIAT1 isoform X1 [Haplochromis burtoni]XP_042078250.1 protein LIAT1 isoform X1 [Haplochromis burtoni]